MPSSQPILPAAGALACTWGCRGHCPTCQAQHLTAPVPPAPADPAR